MENDVSKKRKQKKMNTLKIEVNKLNNIELNKIVLKI